MRGKALFCQAVPECPGITPAYAGKSDPDTLECTHKRDHPRVCGEKLRGAVRFSTAIGSPPRMRGKAYRYVSGTACARITPAYAGKRPAYVGFKRRCWDHPRVCGEKQNVKFTFDAGKGSPPRMRGKVYAMGLNTLGARITPAYAGKRLKRFRSTVSPVAIVPLFPSVCNKPVVSDGSPAGRDAPLFLPAENAVPASPAYNLRSL